MNRVDYNLISIKTPEEIDKMREAGRIAAQVLVELTPHIKPGVTKSQLNKIAYDLIVVKYKAEIDREDLEGNDYASYAAVSFGHNEIIFNGEVDDHPLQVGDIIGVDISIKKDGWCGDTQRMWIVGDETSAVARKLLAVGYEAMWLGISLVRPGAHLDEIAAAVQNHVEKHGFSMIKVLSATGHSIGRVHADGWLIPFYKNPINSGRVLKKGMVITIEPFICVGQGESIRMNNSMRTAVTKDKSLACYWEHVVAVTDTGCEVLDLRPGESQFPIKKS